MLQSTPLIALALGTTLAAGKLAPLAPLLVAAPAAIQAPRAPGELVVPSLGGDTGAVVEAVGSAPPPPSRPSAGALGIAAGTASQTVAGLNPELGAELDTLSKQIASLQSNVTNLEAAAKPVAQSAVKAVDTLASFPGQVDAFKQKYNIPKSPTLTQEVEGVGRFVEDKLGVTPEQANRVGSYLQSSPIYDQLKAPFQPANIMLAVGTTAGMNLLSQINSGEGTDLGKALAFLGQKSFWGGLAGSGVGYSVMAMVATSLFPGGAGLVPVLAPVFAGMVGSSYGWTAGSSLLEGKNMAEGLKALSPSTVLGQAAGSTVGLLVGAQIGQLLGGTLGSVAGPAGAVVGAVLMGQVGARVGAAVKNMLAGDSTDMNAAIAGAGDMISKIKKAEKAVSEIVPAQLPAASMVTGQDAAGLKAEYADAYDKLRNALRAGDKTTAFQELKILEAVAARYEALVGSSLRSLSANN